MKIEQLVQKMKEHGVSLPTVGTGRNGKVLSRDLETAIGDHFLEIKYVNEPVKGKHCQMRRAMTPMKAYRYDKLHTYQQDNLFIDSNDWYAEEKYNGWRMLITYIPGDGFCFWGGNLSDVDCLPTDYTEHILLAGKLHPRSDAFKNFDHTISCAIDAEAVCHGDVETLDGNITNNTLDAIGALLGSGSDRALQLQREGAEIDFMCFDRVKFFEGKPSFDEPLETRNYILRRCILPYIKSRGANFHLTTKHSINKKQELNILWNQGSEGMVFKNSKSTYVPGGRLQTHAIKVKRTMSGEIGDDIDAFITGYIRTPEHTKEGLIGGIQLSVILDCGEGEKTHHIATVTSMSDPMREKLTEPNQLGLPILKGKYMLKVLEIDGQELSDRNRKLMHARVNWHRGFRFDKNWSDCTMKLETMEEEKF